MPNMHNIEHKKILLVGSTGAIGTAIYERLKSVGCHAWSSSRSLQTEIEQQTISLTDLCDENSDLNGIPSFDAIIWAQGANLSDSIDNFNTQEHRKIYNANVMTILQGMSVLVKNDKIQKGSSICIVSSIWQDIARPKKLSYAVSKAALKGVVLSLATDLGPSDIRVNGVLPGPLDTPMTRSNLSDEQLNRFTTDSPLGSLPKLSQVANTILWLVSPLSDGVTGNFIRVDAGITNVRNY